MYKSFQTGFNYKSDKLSKHKRKTSSVNELNSNETFKATDLDKLQFNYKCKEAETFTQDI